ncbi:MAG: type II secretion system protein [Parahaliea sp.]
MRCNKWLSVWQQIRYKPRSARQQRGFSLLEMLVAISILGLSLGVLYQAVGGATRNVRTDERYAYAVELARSLIADSVQVPVGGRSLSGETEGGFRWQAQTRPLELSDSLLQKGQLQAIEVVVSWRDGNRDRQVVLNSVVEGRQSE